MIDFVDRASSAFAKYPTDKVSLNNLPVIAPLTKIGVSTGPKEKDV
jgi:hypothetical protein